MTREEPLSRFRIIHFNFYFIDLTFFFFGHIVYLNGHPYVLRDYADPLQNMVSFLGINASRLEKLEERLKHDVVKEAKNMGGLLLVHQELSGFFY